MLEITLMKSLYHEMDPEHIKEVREFDNQDASKYHELAIDVPGFPEIETMTSEVRYKAYGVAMYYVHFNNDLTADEDITSERAKAAILAFFQKYRPDFLLADLPKDLSEISILDCFDVGKIPDYRPKYAFPGIIMYEDIKSGKYKNEDNSKPTFPGLRMLGGSGKPHDDSKPAYISDKENFTEFNGSNEDFQKKMEELKKQFDIGTILGNK